MDIFRFLAASVLLSLAAQAGATKSLEQSVSFQKVISGSNIAVDTSDADGPLKLVSLPLAMAGPPKALSVSSPPVPVPFKAVTLPSKTPVLVMLDEELSTELNQIGDLFSVTVLNDVLEDGVVVIPQGTKGYGDVTFVTGNGGFGKSGIIAIALRYLDLAGDEFLLDGRYREEGKNKNGAAVATWVAVGVFSGFIRGKDGAIPQGRELKAYTGEDIIYLPQAERTQSEPSPEPALTSPIEAPDDATATDMTAVAADASALTSDEPETR